jgi:hypothetical protein
LGVSVADTLLLEIDGPNLHPDTIDTRATIELVSSFIELIDKTAAVHGVALHLKGFQTVDKCFRLQLETSTPEYALLAAEELERLVGGGEPPVVKGLADATRRFRKAIEKFGPQTTAKVAVGKWERTLKLVEPASTLMPQTRTTLRARLVRIGVAPINAKFESASEADPFTLHITREQARKYSQYLDQPVDIEVTIKRGLLGNIVDGVVHELHPMDENVSDDAWLDWLTKNGRHWNDIPDHLKELGRTDD